MKNKYSIFSLIKNAFSYHENWQKAWKDPAPKKEYDAVIIGGGGHGLATAYYLAKKHNMKNIAVVEKGWIGGGNTGRNTTIIRSNYLWDASAGLYDHALKLWEGLSQEINYNVMFSQRGVMNLAHNLQDIRDLKRRTHANRLNGIDAVYLSTEGVKKFCPIINTSQDIRYPVLGGTLQRRAGTARHDAVAWGYARGADEMGVFFTFVNLIKLPFYLHLSMITSESFLQSVILIPFTIIGIFIGYKILKIIDEKLFYNIIYVLIFLTSSNLIYNFL